ncbi:hypothetical protein ACRAWB_17075 [Leifsonia poae]|uniref:hypothetical protein n=1 Tax=Leifsonia poae TaxID=110933 RepID=UPI003D69F71B
MKPRAAGVLAVIGALLLAVAGGFLIARPPWSILGAIVLVGASILLSIGAVWLLRRSWSDPWPPYVEPSLEKRLRRFRVLVVLNCVLLVAVVALTVYVVASQDWPRLIFSAFLFLMVLSNLSLNQRTLRYLRRAQSSESTSAPEHPA